jgi:Tfp pilus tip-associated adhesin PilY1
VAIFGGGLDNFYNTGDPLVLAGPTATKGRALYIVDIETGKAIFKAHAGTDSAIGSTEFAPMPAPPAVVDYDDDGYLDVVYIGDVNGRMWRLDLNPTTGDISSGKIVGWTPFLLYDSSRLATAGEANQPIYLEASAIYLSGGARPILGIAWGSGNRRDLLKVPNPSVNRFFYVIDDGSSTTLHEGDLKNITPAGGVTPAGSCSTCPTGGYYLDYTSQNEKTTSTVYSTFGYLTLITFTPDSNNPCATDGTSYRYRFFFLNGTGGYNVGSPAGDYTDYRQTAGAGLVAAGQSSTADTTYEWLSRPGGQVEPDPNTNPKRSINQNWKEQ